MAIDTPARLAVLGAGPIGLEAALYARFLGYDVDIFEQGEAAENVRRWGHLRMFTPFRDNRSPLGLGALAAQDPAYTPPDDDACLTGRQWRDAYLLPLAASDLIADHLHTHVRVEAVGRPRRRKTDDVDEETRRDDRFRLLVRSSDGVESLHWADAVIDATGVFATPNWLGAGGIPAIGETANRDRIVCSPPDLEGTDRREYAGRRTLVVGDDPTTAATIVALAELAAAEPGTQIVWISARDLDDGPVRRRSDDPFPLRDALAAEANRLARLSGGAVEFRGGWQVESLARAAAGDGWLVGFDPDSAPDEPFDRLIALVGRRPDERLEAELPIDRCPATSVPRALAAVLPADEPPGVEPCPGGPDRLRLTEPDYYLLGAKSYGRRGDFTVAEGLRQIRDLFTILGDRPTLDLYAQAHRLRDAQ